MTVKANKQRLLLVLFTMCLGYAPAFSENSNTSQNKFKHRKIIYNLGLAKAVCSQQTLFAKSKQIQVPLSDRKSFPQPSAHESCHPVVHNISSTRRRTETHKPPPLSEKIKIRKSFWMYEKNNVNCTDLFLLKTSTSGRYGSERSGEDDVKFYLFSKPTGYSQTEIRFNDEAQFDKTGYVPDGPLVFIIHGFSESVTDGPCYSFKDAYKVDIQHYDYNIICVDWSDLAGSKYNPVSYPFAAAHTTRVGQKTARIIEYIFQKGHVDLDRVHVIGFSLGAHVAGVAGNTVKEILNKEIGRITGLDPAGPFFENAGGLESRRLEKGDAKFVDVIHTAICYLGITLLSGDVDFFPNGGHVQGGDCTALICHFDTCSHKRSRIYFIESISNKLAFPACKCEHYGDYTIPLSCDCTKTANMGHYVQQDKTGVYHLTTNEQAPYSKEL